MYLHFDINVMLFCIFDMMFMLSVNFVAKAQLPVFPPAPREQVLVRPAGRGQPGEGSRQAGMVSGYGART